MDKADKRYIRQYLSRIKLLFPIYSYDERKFLRALRQDIEEFSERGACSSKDITDVFGTPQDVVRAYMETVDQRDLAQRIAKWRFVRNLLTVTIAVALLVFGLRAEYHYREYVKSVNSIVVEVEEIIE